MSYPGTGKERGFKIRTPPMTLPFGVSLYDQQGKNTTYDGPEPIAGFGFDMSFAGHDTDPEVGRFLSTMRKFDEVMVDEGTKNSATWFAKQFDRAFVEMWYRKMVKDSSQPDKNYPPVFKTKTKARDDGTCMVNFFKRDRTPATIHDVQKRCQARFLIGVDRVWFVKMGSSQNFGITWRPEQIMIWCDPPQRDVCSFAMDDDNDNTNTPDEAAVQGGGFVGGGADMEADALE
jgi:hypothetical protein